MQCPPFRADDLRFVGRMRAAPPTRTIRDGALAFGSPVWSEEARLALVGLGEKISGAVLTAIRKEALLLVQAPDWPRGVSAIERVFGLERRPHLFRADPIGWVKFSEPQFTKGFAHFLNAEEPAVRIGRVRALLTALGASLDTDSRSFEVTAEARISQEKRIDILIEWTDSKGRCCAAAIEAKLGHHVTSGQLPAYRNHLRKIAKERRLLVVVSPRRSRDTDEALQRNRDWRWMAWRDLLIAHERALPVECDDDSYLQFRRTLYFKFTNTSSSLYAGAMVDVDHAMLAIDYYDAGDAQRTTELELGDKWPECDENGFAYTCKKLAPIQDGGIDLAPLRKAVDDALVAIKTHESGR